MRFRPAEFADDTDFERFVLERLGTHRVRPAEPGATHDVRGMPAGGGHVIVVVGTATMGTRPREEFRQTLRPLGFGAAYKVLDMLVEHVLRTNGRSGRLAFAKKRATVVNRPVSLPEPLNTRPDLWDRLAALYIKLEDARHAVTHRRAQATTAGDLEIYDEGRRLVDTIPSTEIESFAAAVHATAELVIERSADDRRVNIVAWHLNALHSRHNLPLLSATNPNAGRRLLVMDLVDLGHGHLRIDVARAREIVQGQTAHSLWDLQLHAGDRLFVGRWEDLPDHHEAAFDFYSGSLPSWLSEEVPAA